MLYILSLYGEKGRDSLNQSHTWPGQLSVEAAGEVVKIGLDTQCIRIKLYAFQLKIMSVTTHQIAKSLGIAQATVSRALRHDPRIAQGTRQRVHEAARRMGYRSNLLARSLRTGKTGLLGFVLASLEVESSMRHAMAIERLATAHGYQVLSSCHQGGSEDEIRKVQELHGLQVEGLIAFPVEGEGGANYRKLAQSGFPMVLLNVNTQAMAYPIPSINMDYEDAGWRALQHLAEIGRRRPAFLAGGTNAWSVSARMKGWRRGCESLGIDFDACPMASDPLDGSGEGAMRLSRELLESGATFDAVVASNDVFATVMLKVLQRAGRHVPDDVALIGFDDIHLAQYLHVPLTTFRQPAKHVSELALNLLMAQIQGQPLEQVDHKVQPDLMIRESTLGRKGDEWFMDRCV